MKPKLVVGLIGGIGSGKSSVAAAFAKRGARVISGDGVGHEALRQPDIKKKIVEHWGSCVLDRDGEIDRQTLRDHASARDAVVGNGYRVGHAAGALLAFPEN